MSNGTEFIIHFPLTNKNTQNNKELSAKKIIYIGANFTRPENNSDYVINIYQHPGPVINQVQKSPDCCQILIAEYILPMMNGIELLEIIRRINPNIFLVLVVEQKSPDLDWYVNNRIIDKIIELKFLSDELKILS